MFRIKICGVRKLEDVAVAERAGADCVGLNFFPSSPRYVDPQFVAELAAEKRRLQTAGVFVNVPIDRLMQIADDGQLDWIQLHGDESPRLGQQLIENGYRVIRAIRLPTASLNVQQIEAMVRPWADIGARLLLDADGGPAFGGSGQRLDWQGIGRWSTLTSQTDWILAGGLTADNAALAIAESGATAVDVAGGTESIKGVKDPQRIEQFIAAALQQWESGQS